jgi:hypothetical protein
MSDGTTRFTCNGQVIKHNMVKNGLISLLSQFPLITMKTLKLGRDVLHSQSIRSLTRPTSARYF